MPFPCPTAPVAPGRVDFQLVRNFLGGFIQMRRVLCDPAGWRDMMKAYLEKLGADSETFGLEIMGNHRIFMYFQWLVGTVIFKWLVN